MITIGIDIGTTSICGVLYNSTENKVIRSTTVKHNALLKTDQAFAHLMDAERLVSIAGQLYDEMLEHAPDTVSGVCVTGQMHGIVYLDDKGSTLSPLFTWMDMRGNLSRGENESYAEYYSNLTGYSLKSGYGALTHLYNIEHYCVPDGAAKLCTIMDLFAMRLCGHDTPVTDPSNAASLGLFDITKGAFDFSSLDPAEAMAHLFPAVLPTDSIIGHTKENIPVFNSLGDNQAGTYYAIGLRKDAILLNIGTSGQVSVVSDRGCAAVGIDTRPYLQGKSLLVGAFLNGGNIYEKLKSFFEEVLTVFGFKPGNDTYAIMNQILARGLGQHTSLVADTRFLGTRTDPDVRGSIVNISLQNFTVASLLTAFAEGIIREGYQLYENLPAELKAEHKEIIVAGNLLKRSEPFRKIAESMFGLPVSMTDSIEETAAGAAKIAADFQPNS